jgi:hypothetical protein
MARPNAVLEIVFGSEVLSRTVGGPGMVTISSICLHATTSVWWMFELNTSPTAAEDGAEAQTRKGRTNAQENSP